jgi:hypothetical protein
MLTEESKTHEIPQARFIVVDEIDGTAPFAAGADTWGVMLALVDEAPTCGVIHLPEKQVTIMALREQGCWINNRRVRMHFDGALRDALAGVDVSTRADDAGWRLIRNVAARARAMRSFSCAAASALELLEGVTALRQSRRQDLGLRADCRCNRGSGRNGAGGRQHVAVGSTREGFPPREIGAGRGPRAALRLHARGSTGPRQRLPPRPADALSRRRRQMP